MALDPFDRGTVDVPLPAEAAAEGESDAGAEQEHNRRATLVIELIQDIRRRELASVDLAKLPRDLHERNKVWESILRRADQRIEASLAQYGYTWDQCDHWPPLPQDVRRRAMEARK